MEILQFFLPFAAAWVVALAGSALAIRMGHRYRLYADPRKLRFFERQVVALGGVPWFLAFFLVALYTVFSVPQGADGIYSQDAMVEKLGGLLGGALLLLAVGLYSLRKPQRAWSMWLVLVVAVVIVYLSHLRIEAVALFRWKVIALGPLSFLATLLWFLLVVAIVEILDSVDGLANLALILGGGIGFAGVGFDREVYVPMFYAALVGSTLGCLWTNNFHPRMVYGPSGNKLVGFVFAAVILLARQKETAVQVVIFPVALVTLVVAFFAMTYFETRGASAKPNSAENNTRRE